MATTTRSLKRLKDNNPRGKRGAGRGRQDGCGCGCGGGGGDGDGSGILSSKVALMLSSVGIIALLMIHFRNGDSGFDPVGFTTTTTTAAAWSRQAATTTTANQHHDQLQQQDEGQLVVSRLDKGACRLAILAATEPLLVEKKLVPSAMLSREQLVNVRDTMVKVVVNNPSTVKGDWVETGTWRGGGGGAASSAAAAALLAAFVQKTALETPSCGQPHKRSIWLADSSFDGTVNDDTVVKQLFVEYGFAVDGSGPVPVYFLKGPFEQTLPDSTIEDIAVLRLDGGGPDGGDGDMYASTLHVLFALYRRVNIGGYVIIDDYGRRSQCKKAIDEFFVDANFDLQRTDDAGRWFQKNNTDVRVPPEYNEKHIQRQPKVQEAWETLARWHKETTRKFFGNVGSNNFQTFRYTEALRHIIQRKQRQQQQQQQGVVSTTVIVPPPVRVNVCETGFNGGHSAMLFMSFLHKDQGSTTSSSSSSSSSPVVDLHYYGWDLKEVGSSAPIAAKMQETYGDNFHITWGDSKETLKDISNILGGGSNGQDQQQQQRCDLVVVDGEHSKVGVRSDLQYLLPHSNTGAVVFGDDCAPYKKTVRQAQEMKDAWNEYVSSNKIIPVAYYRNPQLGSPGFVEGTVP